MTAMSLFYKYFFRAIVSVMWTPSLVAMRPIFSIAIAVKIGYRTHFMATSK